MKFLFVKTKKIGGVEKSIEPSLHIFRESVLSIPFLGGEDDIFATDLFTKKRKSCGSGRLTNDAVKGRFRARVGARWRGKRNNTAGGIRE